MHQCDFPVIEQYEEIILQGSTFHLDQERRIDYIRHKKNPQLSWFVQRIYELFDGNCCDQPLNIPGVGGGRGDLSALSLST
jgi:hypothetical protein